MDTTPTRHPPFLLGGLAAMGACLVSNPFEVVKIRMQLEGELQMRGSYQRQYRNVPQAFLTIIRHEGLTAVQSGLISGLGYQGVMNGTRLGVYPALKRQMEDWEIYRQCPIMCRLTIAAMAGCLGAAIGSPFYLAKTRLQSRSAGPLMIGTQYDYKNLRDCFRKIIAKDGVVGLWRGVGSSLPRVTMGSAVQLTTYDTCKAWILGTGRVGDNLCSHVMASLVSSIFVVVSMNPFDVVSTRIYNQPVIGNQGSLYTGVGNCLVKIVKTEGFFSLWKGLGAHYLRLGPHTILTFVLWEQLLAIFHRWN